MKEILDLIEKAEAIAKRQNESTNNFRWDYWEVSRQMIMNEAKTLSEKQGYNWKDIILTYYKERG